MDKQNYLVSDVMNQPTATVTPDTSVARVLQLSASQNIYHFPIVAGKKAIGLVCACDLQEAAKDSKVWQFARHPAIAVSPSSSVRKAARLMTQYVVESVVVTNEDGLCGIVTRRDLLSADPRLERLMNESHCTGCRESGNCVGKSTAPPHVTRAAEGSWGREAVWA